MKKICLLLLFFTSNIEAQEICKDYKPEITNRDKEDWHSEESALRALKFLEMYVKNENKARNTDPWWVPARVQGAILRIAALEADVNTESNEYQSYCRFVTRQGVHREH